MARVAEWLGGGATVVVLAGCPFLFEPPDESNVPGGDAQNPDGDADTDGDADSDADSDADTDVDENAPSIPSFTVSPRLDSVLVRFSIADLDDDLVGGTIVISNGSSEYPLAIPGEIVPSWEPNGISIVELPTQLPIDCSEPVNQTWTITATDLAGHSGPAKEFQLGIPAVGVVPEGFVWPEPHLVSDFPPFSGCVEYEQADPDDTTTPVRNQLRADFEAVGFTTPSTGNYIIEVDWDHSNPYDTDVYVYYMVGGTTVDLNPADGYADTITSAYTVGDVAEQVTFAATAGDDWMVDFPFWNFYPDTTQPYRAMFLVTPE
jgi:hypothetical protein